MPGHILGVIRAPSELYLGVISVFFCYVHFFVFSVSNALRPKAELKGEISGVPRY